ncbi:MAG TPA: LysM peptidoglycan-binding domain-containing protein [Desulfobacteraceae bacterium]|nr:LysM peptidoglycan-binding domain-containing protein [Desulfobacteraceae bacterium]
MVEKKDTGMESLNFSEEMVDDFKYTRPGSRRPRASVPAGFPIKWILIAAAAFLFLVVISVKLFGGGAKISSEEFDALRSSVAGIEHQLEQMESIFERVTLLERQDEEIRDSISNMSETLGTVSQRLASLTQKFESSQKKPPAPASSTGTPPAAGSTVHEVKAGETLYSIAGKYNMSVNDLLRLNKLGSNSTIHPGQKLVVDR